MKYLDDFRSVDGVEYYRDKIASLVSKPWQIMEICGGQTHSILKNGLHSLLPDSVNLIHGPGCPVCVTPAAVIDRAIEISEQDNVILCSYGGILRVRGTPRCLLDAKSRGADVRVLYSPNDAVDIAKNNLDKEVVFLAIGFETTAPGNAQAVRRAKQLQLDNFSALVSQVTVPPAMKFLLESKDNNIDGFLAAGHVCTVMGYWQYHSIARQYSIPIVVTGFEPVDIMRGLYHCLMQLENRTNVVENCYGRCVSEPGNKVAQNLLEDVFDTVDMEWRGIGTIPLSGLGISAAYRQHDANLKFQKSESHEERTNDCISGLILQGVKKPTQCPYFGKKCTPENPLGATMVSEEGACAAYYHYI